MVPVSECRISGFLRNAAFYDGAMDPMIATGLAKAGVATASRHLFLCIGPDCCRPSDGAVVWECVKKRVKETGLRAMRTKAGCFRICAGGPWLVVYPDGIWYGGITPERFERILQEHLLGGEPIREWMVANNALCAEGGSRVPLREGSECDAGGA